MARSLRSRRSPSAGVGGLPERNVGQGWASGLAGLATDFGITVDADADKADPPPVTAVTQDRPR